MLVQTEITQEIDYFSHKDRPGVQIAKDIFSMLSENFAVLDKDHNGCINGIEISNFDGNQRLRQFLDNNAKYLAGLSFNAKGLSDLLQDSLLPKKDNCISFADLRTFSLLAEEINRRNFYDYKFQGVREGAGLNAAALSFIAGILAGWATLVIVFSKLHIHFAPMEAIAIGVLATVGIPLCFTMIGYVFGTRKADAYFLSRVNRIDLILAYLEKIS